MPIPAGSLLQNYRLSISKGDRAGAWLWTVDVRKNGLAMQGLDWPGIEVNFQDYEVHLEFINDESAAYRANFATAERLQRILRLRSIETEIREV